MADKFSVEKRSRIMAAVKSSATAPERAVFSELLKLGIRRRRHRRLPGKPDAAFPLERVAVFIDGCFWHGCPVHFRAPESNAAFWRAKILANAARDDKNNKALADAGWLVLRIWEHDTTKKGAAASCAQRIKDALYARSGKTEGIDD